MTLQSTSSCQDQMKTSVQRRASLNVSSKIKKRRHCSMRGQLLTPVKSRRRWSLNARSTGKRKYDVTSEIMSTIYGTNDQSRKQQSKVAVNLKMNPAKIA